MKTLLIGLLALTSAIAFASSKEIINCSSKYETFTVTKITAANSEALEILNESLEITEESSIAFGQNNAIALP